MANRWAASCLIRRSGPCYRHLTFCMKTADMLSYSLFHPPPCNSTDQHGRYSTNDWTQIAPMLTAFTHSALLLPSLLFCSDSLCFPMIAVHCHQPSIHPSILAQVTGAFPFSTCQRLRPATPSYAVEGRRTMGSVFACSAEECAAPAAAMQ